jgi:hypothetical protein
MGRMSFVAVVTHIKEFKKLENLKRRNRLVEKQRGRVIIKCKI